MLTLILDVCHTVALKFVYINIKLSWKLPVQRLGIVNRKIFGGL